MERAWRRNFSDVTRIATLSIGYRADLSVPAGVPDIVDLGTIKTRAKIGGVLGANCEKNPPACFSVIFANMPDLMR